MPGTDQFGVSAEQLAHWRTRFSDAEIARMLGDRLGHFGQRLFRRDLEALAAQSPSGTYVSLILVYIDNLRTTMDRLSKHVRAPFVEQVGRLTSKETELLRGTAYRTGHEEFAALLPQTTQSAAYQIANDLRAVIEASNVTCHAPNDDGIWKLTTLPVTCSLGVATAPRDTGWGADELHRAAEGAMEAARAAGGNRAVVSPRWRG